MHLGSSPRSVVTEQTGQAWTQPTQTSWQRPIAPKTPAWTSRRIRCPVCIVVWRSWRTIRRTSKLPSLPKWTSWQPKYVKSSLTSQRIPPLLTLYPHRPRQLLEHHRPHWSTQRLDASPHPKSFLVSPENAGLSLLTVKCIMNTCPQPFLQRGLKWHLWFPISPGERGRGRVVPWFINLWSRDSSICGSLDEFKQALRRAVDPLSSDREKARELSNIRQGIDPVCDYAIRFRTLATDSGWNATALYDVFLKVLSDQIQDLLVPLDLPSDLDSLITLAIRTDNRLQERQRSRNLAASSAGRHGSRTAVLPPSRLSSSRFPSPVPRRRVSSEEEEEPMQLGRAKLSSEERCRRLQEGRCFYCGKPGHLLAACPAKEQARQ